MIRSQIDGWHDGILALCNCQVVGVMLAKMCMANANMLKL